MNYLIKYAGDALILKDIQIYIKCTLIILLLYNRDLLEKTVCNIVYCCHSYINATYHLCKLSCKTMLMTRVGEYAYNVNSPIRINVTCGKSFLCKQWFTLYLYLFSSGNGFSFAVIIFYVVCYVTTNHIKDLMYYILSIAYYLMSYK